MHITTLRARQPVETTGEFAKNLLALPLQINLLELHSHLLLAGKGTKGVIVGLGSVILNNSGRLQLLHDLCYLRLGEIIEHPAETFQGIYIVPLKTVAVIFGDYQIELTRHPTQTGTDIALLYLLLD